MGVYDYIDFKAPCPNCGEELTRWQSKDGPRGFLKLKPWEVNHFYSICMCGHWVEYRRKGTSEPEERIPPPEPPGWLEEFEIKVEQLPLVSRKDGHE